MTTIAKPTARQLLTPSRLDPLAGMKSDVDLSNLMMFFSQVPRVNLGAALTEAVIQRTVQGASTVVCTVQDQDFALLRSGLLSSKQDISIDGMFFRLAAVSRQQGRTLTLTFEDREVALLRTYDRPIKQSGATSRTKVTRAHFILRMIQEVKEETIPWFIPALNIVQPLDTYKAAASAMQVVAPQKGTGIGPGSLLRIKGAQITEEQRTNANTILTVGSSLGMQRMILVIAIMVAIQESSLRNLDYPHPGDGNYISVDKFSNPVGVFQQIRKWGWPATRDVGQDAAGFFKKAAQYVTSGMQYYQIAEKVQNSGNGKAYANWRTEADRVVTEFGNPTTTTQDANSQWNLSNTSAEYEFYRGLPPTTTTRKQKYGRNWGPESSWDCIQRLAGEVNWRAFFTVGPLGENTFYYIAETDLFKSQPIAVISDDTPGVQEIAGDYDENSKVATVTLTVRMNRWAAPPGSIVTLTDMGPWNGRWLVNDVQRSAFLSQATITLKKPMPRLPESSSGNLANAASAPTWTGADPPGGLTSDIAGTPAAAAAVAFAKSQLGVPYVWGAEEIGVAFDCSGLVQAAYSAGGIKLPRVAQAQYDFGRVLSLLEPLRPGDLVFFGSDVLHIEHVGIYVGDGQMIDAPNSTSQVRYDASFRLWTEPVYQGATRPTSVA